jgi:hypothetical protein
VGARRGAAPTPTSSGPAGYSGKKRAEVVVSPSTFRGRSRSRMGLGHAAGVVTSGLVGPARQQTAELVDKNCHLAGFGRLFGECR